jgi:hypothetical protein
VALLPQTRPMGALTKTTTCDLETGIPASSFTVEMCHFLHLTVCVLLREQKLLHGSGVLEAIPVKRNCLFPGGSGALPVQYWSKMVRLLTAAWRGVGGQGDEGYGPRKQIFLIRYPHLLHIGMARKDSGPHH